MCHDEPRPPASIAFNAPVGSPTLGSLAISLPPPRTVTALRLRRSSRFRFSHPASSLSSLPLSTRNLECRARLTGSRLGFMFIIRNKLCDISKSFKKRTSMRHHMPQGSFPVSDSPFHGNKAALSVRARPLSADATEFDTALGCFRPIRPEPCVIHRV